jgi:hypothetical protein
MATEVSPQGTGGPSCGSTSATTQHGRGLQPPGNSRVAFAHGAASWPEVETAG